MSILLLAAVLPPLYLVFQIYKMDSVEKEPPGLLLKLLVGGGVMVFPAAMIENVFSFLHSSPALSWWAAAFIENFIVVALTEELCKFLALKFLTWKNPDFNYTFDGIVYAVVVSLGFALVENVMYTALFGMQVALIRAFTAIVAHAVFGVMMGSCYGKSRSEAVQGNNASASSLQARGVIMAVILHGAYDFTASQDTGLFTLGFFLIVVAMYVVTYRRVGKARANDAPVDEPKDYKW